MTSKVVPIRPPEVEPFASILMRCKPMTEGPIRLQPVLGIMVNMDLLTVTFLGSVLAAFRSFAEAIPHAELKQAIIVNRHGRLVIGARDKDGLEFLRGLEDSEVTYSSDVLPMVTLPDTDGSLVVKEDGFYWLVSVGGEIYKSEELTLHSIQLAMSVDHAR